MPKSSNRTPAKKQNIPGPAPSVTAPSVTAPSVQAPSMFDTMKQGFSFGVGSSIAHNLFDNRKKDEVVNKKEPPVEPKLPADKIYELYAICLDKNDNNIDCSKILEQANSK
jgi:hypothetical protein